MAGIRIDELDVTGSPSADHEIPAMKDGLTVKLTIAQIVDLVATVIVGAAPAQLDTINELAAALGDDENYAATVTSALAGKQPLAAALTALGALTLAADKLPYGDSSGTMALTTLTAFARTLLGADSYYTLLGAAGMRFSIGSGNMADDAAFALDIGGGIPLYGGVVRLIGNTVNNGVGDFFVRAASSPTITALFQAGSVINIVAGDGTLTGTTGTDGKVNIRAASDGTLYVENRLGSIISMNAFVFK